MGLCTECQAKRDKVRRPVVNEAVQPFGGEPLGTLFMGEGTIEASKHANSEFPDYPVISAFVDGSLDEMLVNYTEYFSQKNPETDPDTWLKLTASRLYNEYMSEAEKLTEDRKVDSAMTVLYEGWQDRLSEGSFETYLSEVTGISVNAFVRELEESEAE
jgi:hypothetical protein